LVYKRRKGIAIVDKPHGILVVAGRSKKFMLPGGGANRHESRKTATIRELYEETGLKTVDIKYFFSYIGGKWHTRRGAVRNHTKVFLVKTKDKARPRHEIKYIDYWTPENNVNISKGTLKIISKYLAMHKNQV